MEIPGNPVSQKSRLAKELGLQSGKILAYWVWKSPWGKPTSIWKMDENGWKWMKFAHLNIYHVLPVTHCEFPDLYQFPAGVPSKVDSWS